MARQSRRPPSIPTMRTTTDQNRSVTHGRHLRDVPQQEERAHREQVAVGLVLQLAQGDQRVPHVEGAGEELVRGLDQRGLGVTRGLSDLLEHRRDHEQEVDEQRGPGRPVSGVFLGGTGLHGVNKVQGTLWNTRPHGRAHFGTAAGARRRAPHHRRHDDERHDVSLHNSGRSTARSGGVRRGRRPLRRAAGAERRGPGTADDRCPPSQHLARQPRGHREGRPGHELAPRPGPDAPLPAGHTADREGLPARQLCDRSRDGSLAAPPDRPVRHGRHPPGRASLDLPGLDLRGLRDRAPDRGSRGHVDLADSPERHGRDPVRRADPDAGRRFRPATRPRGARSPSGRARRRPRHPRPGLRGRPQLARPARLPRGVRGRHGGGPDRPERPRVRAVRRRAHPGEGRPLPPPVRDPAGLPGAVDGGLAQPLRPSYGARCRLRHGPGRHRRNSAAPGSGPHRGGRTGVRLDRRSPVAVRRARHRAVDHAAPGVRRRRPSVAPCDHVHLAGPGRHHPQQPVREQ